MKAQQDGRPSGSRSPAAWYEVSLGAFGAATAVWLALAVAAAAQAPADRAPTLQSPNVQQGGEPAPRLPSTGETLSERLEKSDGVIKPPAGVDPDIKVAPNAPAAGRNMPVIPPSQVPPNPPRAN
jgi:hypothetical protein